MFNNSNNSCHQNRFKNIVIFLFLICNLNLAHQFGSKSSLFASRAERDAPDLEQCFCKLHGDVDDCNCKIDYIDKYNNYRLHPRINNLIETPYFRYIKINLNKICQFWADDARCSLKDCHVKVCNEDELPERFREILKQQSNDDKSIENCEQSNPLGRINNTLTEENLKTFEEWNRYDAAASQQDNFVDSIDDESDINVEYLDLLTNQERYTGYKGPHAHKIWNSIYKENCFEDNQNTNAYGPLESASSSGTCLEKRAFYRLISGLQTSINLHLVSRWLHRGIINQPDHWGPNPLEFKKRFDPEYTNGMGPQWLKNLYFLYLVELRAIHKLAPHLLEKETFFTGDFSADEDTKKAVEDFLKTVQEFQSHFDESTLFKSDDAKKLKEEIQTKFRNITRIMDCVGCDKCRLWGKVQTLGLGTALKILFSANELKLSRTEIVALFNAFARLSNSIAQIENFRELISNRDAASTPLYDSNETSRLKAIKQDL